MIYQMNHNLFIWKNISHLPLIKNHDILLIAPTKTYPTHRYRTFAYRYHYHLHLSKQSLQNPCIHFAPQRTTIQAIATKPLTIE